MVMVLAGLNLVNILLGVSFNSCAVVVGDGDNDDDDGGGDYYGEDDGTVTGLSISRSTRPSDG